MANFNPVNQLENNLDKQDLSSSETDFFSPAENINPALKKPIFKQKIFRIFLLVLVLSLAGISSFLLYNKFFTKSAAPAINKIPTESETTTATTKPTIEVQPTYHKAQWLLKKKTDAGLETVIALPAIENQIVIWQDWLIYGSGDYTDNVQILAYNLKTGEEYSIYEEALRNDFKSNSKYVSAIEVFNDQLFFSIEGYMTEGGTFWMPLTNFGQVTKVEGGSGHITYWRNKYWLINGMGDACFSGRSSALFNLTTKKVTQIADSVTGCVEGEETIDIDKRDRMIMAFHDADVNDEEFRNGMYKYIFAIPLDNPSQKEGVIAKQDMPDGIRSIRYLAETDQLLLVGSEKYVFDFASQTLTKTDLPVPTPTPQQEEKRFQDKIKEIQLPDGYEWVKE